MREFKFDDHITIVCEWKKTRTAFKHEAVLLIDGEEVDRTKICYLNRTWESYEFQSVIYKLLEGTKILTPEQKALFIAIAKKDHSDNSAFKMTAMIASMGDILCDSQKEKNDWKARMIKAGLGTSGIQMPEDWQTLSEDDKEQRLDAVIKQMQEVRQ